MTDAMDLGEPIVEAGQVGSSPSQTSVDAISLPDAPGDTLANAKALVSDLAERAKTVLQLALN